MPEVKTNYWFARRSAALFLAAGLLVSCAGTTLEGEPGIVTPTPSTSTSEGVGSNDVSNDGNKASDLTLPQPTTSAEITNPTSTSVTTPEVVVTVTTEAEQVTPNTTQAPTTTIPDVITEEPNTYSDGFESVEPERA